MPDSNDSPRPWETPLSAADVCFRGVRGRRPYGIIAASPIAPAVDPTLKGAK